MARWRSSTCGAVAGSRSRSIKKAEGIYAVVDLQATPEAVAELDRQLRLNESILRTKVIRPETR